MTRYQFHEVISRTRLGQPMQETVYLVFVDGLSISESARRAGVSKSALREAVAKIKQVCKESLECPSEWEVITVCLPRDKARKIKKWANRLREQMSDN